MTRNGVKSLSNFLSFVRNGDLEGAKAFIAIHPNYHTNIMHMRVAVMTGNVELIKLVYDHRGCNDVLEPSFFACAKTQENYNLSSPLIIAIQSGNTEVVKTLLDYCHASSASTFVCDTQIYNTKEMKVLSRKGDKPEIGEMNRESMTVFTVTRIQNLDTIINIAARYANKEILSLILNHENNGENCNYYYGSNGSEIVMQYDELDAVDKINMPSKFDANGMQKFLTTISPNGGQHFVTTPLHTAVLVNNLDVIPLLVEKGANINNQSCEMQIGNYWLSTEKLLHATPLHIAILYGKNDMVKALLESNADISIEATIVNAPRFFGSVSTNNVTCLELAKNIGNKEMIALLESYVTDSNPNAYNEKIDINIEHHNELHQAEDSGY